VTSVTFAVTSNPQTSVSRIEKPSLSSGKNDKKRTDVKMKDQNNTDHLLMPKKLSIINSFQQKSIGYSTFKFWTFRTVYLSEKIKSLDRQVYFASWEYAFQRSTFYKTIFGKRHIKVLEHPLQSLTCPHMTFPEGIILNPMKTFRAVHWQQWNDIWKMTSRHVSGHRRWNAYTVRKQIFWHNHQTLVTIYFLLQNVVVIPHIQESLVLTCTKNALNCSGRRARFHYVLLHSCHT
jgi:hypothetical protein